MPHRQNRAATSLLVLAFVCLSGGNAAAVCGALGETPCQIEKKVYCGDPNNLCTRLKQVCQPLWPRLDQNGHCAARLPTAIPVPNAVDFMDGGTHVTEGHVVTVDLAKTTPVVPRTSDPPSCPDGNLSTVVPNVPDVPTDNWVDDPAYAPRLAVNGSYFEVRPGQTPWTEKCAYIFAYTLSNGVQVRQEEKIQTSDNETLIPGTLVFSAPQGGGVTADIMWYPYSGGPPKAFNAISGVQLVKQGNYVGDAASGPVASEHRPRTAVGLTNDKSSLIIVSVSGPKSDGTTSLQSLAKYLIALGAHNAINLDGGGSAQFYYVRDNGLVIKSLPTDTPPEYKPLTLYRPVGNFLGFQ